VLDWTNYSDDKMAQLNALLSRMRAHKWDVVQTR
jgi:hypothetical protein